MTQILIKLQVFCYVTASLGEYSPTLQIIVYLLLSGLSSETLNLARRIIYWMCSRDGKSMQDSGFVPNDILWY